MLKYLMIHLFYLRVLLFVYLVFATLPANAKTRISVTSLENKAGGDCYYSYYNDLGDGMAEQLITKLSDMDRYEVLERQTIRQMHEQEQELVNQDETTAPKRNKFRIAQYSISGAVTSFEYCAGGASAGVNVGQWIGFGDLRVGGKKAQALVVLDLRVIDVETGKVLKSVRSEGKTSRVKLAVEGDVKGVDFGSDAFYNSPIGEATRKALSNAADQLAKVIPNLPDQSGKKKVATTSSHSVNRHAYPTEFQGTTIHCLASAEACTQVKVVEKSEKGKNYQVYDLAQKEKDWVSAGELYEVAPITAISAIQDGETILAKFAKDHAYYRCTVLDKASQSVIADCPAYREEQMSVPVSKLYRTTQFSQ